MKKLLLIALMAVVSTFANATAFEVVDGYKDFSSSPSINWGSDAANARISFSDGCFVYSSTEATANNWDAQYWVMGGMSFKPEETYKVTMMIKGSVDGTIGNIKLGDWGQGKDNYGALNFTTEFAEQTISVTGVPGGDGVLFQTGSFVGDIYIKWIKVSHETDVDTDLLCLAATDIPTGANVWDNQVQYSFDTPIPAGNYKLSLDMKGDAEGAFNVWGTWTDDNAYYGPGDISFVTEWTHKEITLNLGKELKQMNFVFGTYGGTTLYIDNIVLTKEGESENLIPNGNFASYNKGNWKIAGWWSTYEDSEGATHWVNHSANFGLIEGPAHYTTITAPDADWFTYCSDKNLKFAETGLTAYKAITVNSSVVKLEEIEGVVPAGTGVLLKGTGGAHNVLESVDDTAVEGNLLKGTLVAKALANNEAYVIANGADGVAFYLCNAGTLAANKAYLPASAVSTPGAPLKITLIDDETTAIEAVAVENETNNAIFNIAGQKVSENYKGIVIKSGKKVLVK